jgi:hypothetical protein
VTIEDGSGVPAILSMIKRPSAAGILVVAAVALALLATGCGHGESSSGRSASAPDAPKQVIGGCGGTAAYRGANPEWTESAQVPRTPYALGHAGNAAAFLWARPLRAGHPQNPANKILWVVRLPRNGHSLSVSGHPSGSPDPAVKYTRPSDSGPGEIYPSTIDVPTPGCWRFELQWGSHMDRVELMYRAARRSKQQ